MVPNGQIARLHSKGKPVQADASQLDLAFKRFTECCRDPLAESRFKIAGADGDAESGSDNCADRRKQNDAGAPAHGDSESSMRKASTLVGADALPKRPACRSG